MFSNRKFALPLFAALAILVLGIGASACGYKTDDTHVAEGESVYLGDLQFNVIFSRYLNPNDTEDAAYLEGQPEPGEGETYFGVFLLVQNENNEANALPDTATITDVDNQEYKLVESESLYAFPFGTEVEEQEQIPVLDSTPQQGPIEGSLALFLLPEAASENRPLTLHLANDEGEEVEIGLDL
ncbi:MAG TPA: hypothetical protein VG518_09255 [Solirubrobacterales bacterium]|nr:hypothetical protein [Solirubrobacterales bacterium]